MRSRGVGEDDIRAAVGAEGYIRLSIDEEVWRRFGRYGIDDDSAQYREHSAAIEPGLGHRLVSLIQQGRDVVVDFSFWRRATRDHYKRLIERAGGSWRLLYLKIDPAVLRARLHDRRQRFDANAPFPITDDILSSYLAGFEEPSGEGEEVITSSAP